MKVFVAVLLLVFSMLQAQAPESPANSGAVSSQTEHASNDYLLTVEARKTTLRQLEESVRLAINSGQNLEAARKLTRIGRLHLLLNDPDAAIASHIYALDLLSTSPNTEVEIDNLNGSAVVYLKLGKKDALAKEAVDKALNLSRQVHYLLGEAQALLSLSEWQNHTRHSAAVLTAQASLPMWKALDNKQGLIEAYIQIGTYYLAQTLLDDAAANFNSALEVSRSSNNSPKQAEALTNLGFIEHRRGELEAAIDLYTQAYGMLDESAEARKMGQIAAGLGAAFTENGLPESAVPQYERALKSYQATEDKSDISWALYGLGKSYFLLGDLTQASNYIQQSLDLVDENSLEAALPLELLGRIYSERGEYVQALEKFNSALTILTDENFREMAQVEALMGQVYYRQGLLSTARPHYEEAFKIFSRLSDRVNQAAVYYALGQLEMKQQNYGAASGYLQQSLALTENIRRVSTSSDLTAAFSQKFQDRYEAYIECLMKLDGQQPSRGLAIEAFQTSELARARALSEMLLAQQSNLAPGVDPGLAAREKSLRQKLRMIENEKISLLGKKSDQKTLRTIEAETARLEDDYKSVSEQIRSNHPEYDTFSQPTAWTLQQIQKKILDDDDAVLLEYSLGTEGSYAWTISRNEFTSYKLPPRPKIDDAIKKVYSRLSDPAPGDKSELDLAVDELSKLVLSPVARSLNKRRVIVVPDGALNYVPFQLLYESAKNNGPLIAAHEVVNVPSASILGQLRQEKQQRRPSTKVLAAFGDPVFVSNYSQFQDPSAKELVASAQPTGTATWQRALRNVEIDADVFNPASIQPLLYTKLELGTLREIAGSKSLVASGFAASRQMLDSLDLSQYAILHFATHGLLDPKKPEQSGFLLSMVDATGHPQDGFITMRDIYRLHAPVDLVVLSACRTGLGKDVRGEGLIGLTRGFMYAGASSVVASLWQVDDEATAELMKHFYTNMLQKGMRPAEALRAAQNTLRQNPTWQSPHFWAGFILQGEFKEPIRLPEATGAPRAVQNGVGAALLILLLAAIAWGLWRRRQLPN